MTTPELNTLNVNSFIADIPRIPLMKYMIQDITFPGISLPEIPAGNPFVVINEVGDHLIYDELTFTFMVDERLLNYRCIYNWMVGLGFPEDFEQFANFIKGQTGDENILTFSQSPLQNQFSDVKITILSNHKNPLVTYTFKDAFPINLSGFNINVTGSISEPVTATCTMKYTNLTIKPEV